MVSNCGGFFIFFGDIKVENGVKFGNFVLGSGDTQGVSAVQDGAHRRVHTSEGS